MRARSNSTPARPYIALQCLEPANLTLCLAIARSLGDRVPHRRQVLLQRAHEAAHAVDPPSARIAQPLIELADVAAAEDATEPHRQLDMVAKSVDATFSLSTFPAGCTVSRPSAALPENRRK